MVFVPVALVPVPLVPVPLVSVRFVLGALAFTKLRAASGKETAKKLQKMQNQGAKPEARGGVTAGCPCATGRAGVQFAA